ncbi:MAG: hypothetical protein GY938_16735 [Ketobacter sp.]|nr:hypothetical protein [Ketobacter sp.]
MGKRPDQLSISLGKFPEQRKAALMVIAEEWKATGYHVTRISISALICMIADGEFELVKKEKHNDF